MPGAYTQQQALFPCFYNFGATVAAMTAEVWGLGLVASDIPTMQLASASLSNGANLGSDTTHYTTISILNGSTSMASITNNGNAWVADTPEAMTLSTTVANRRAVGGDTLKLDKTDTMNGGALTAVATCAMWWRIGSDDLGAS